MVTQTSIAPLSVDTFWINYSNLLLSVWSVPDMRGNLKSDPAKVLSYFDLATVPGAQFEIIEQIDPGAASFDDQYKVFAEGHRSGRYRLVVPEHHPGIAAAQGAGDLALAAADTVSCCCCSCCPCCSCF